MTTSEMRKAFQLSDGPGRFLTHYRGWEPEKSRSPLKPTTELRVFGFRCQWVRRKNCEKVEGKG